MRNLARFLANPFDSPAISLAELTAFTTDHIERMIANNPDGELDARISATTAAFGELETAFTQDLLQLGSRKARKTAKRLFRDGLRAQTNRIEGALRGAFGAHAAQVQEAFPQGRGIFNQCQDDDLNNHLDIMNTVVAANAANLPASVVTLSSGLVTNWSTLYQESESATGGKTATEADKRAAREALQLELYHNLTKLMELFPGLPGRLPLYMQQHLLEDNPASQVEDPEDEENGQEEEPPPTPET